MSDAGPPPDDETPLERGLRIRREVLGDAYVDQATTRGWDFGQDHQKIVSTTVWNAIWGRETLPRRERILMTLAMTAALNRDEEFELHLHAALRNGVSLEDLKEVCIHIHGYCGAPAGVASMRSLRKVVEKMDADV